MALDCQRHVFDLPEHVHYLNCAYKGPFLKEVVQEGIRVLQRQLHPFTYTERDFFEPKEEAKQLFAGLINCDIPQRIAIIPSASYGIATVTHNVRLDPASNVVVTKDQFPSNMYPWMRLCQRDGAVLKMISKPESGRWTDDIKAAIDDNTRVVSVGNVHWTDGTLIDLATLSARAHEVGALMIVDGTQSIGVLPFDIQKVKADAVICAGYKWLLAPYSIGAAYYGPYFDDKFPLEENWISREKSDDFRALINYQDKYRPYAYRFSSGESSNFILLPMFIHAMKQMNIWRADRIQEYAKSITEPYVNLLHNIGFIVNPSEERVGHLFGIGIPDHIPLDLLKARLSDANVFVSLRGQNIRIAVHVFNRMEDMEALVSVLKSF